MEDREWFYFFLANMRNPKWHDFICTDGSRWWQGCCCILAMKKKIHPSLWHVFSRPYSSTKMDHLNIYNKTCVSTMCASKHWSDFLWFSRKQVACTNGAISVILTKIPTLSLSLFSFPLLSDRAWVFTGWLSNYANMKLLTPVSNESHTGAFRHLQASCRYHPVQATTEGSKL